MEEENEKFLKLKKAYEMAMDVEGTRVKNIGENESPMWIVGSSNWLEDIKLSAMGNIVCECCDKHVKFYKTDETPQNKTKTHLNDFGSADNINIEPLIDMVKLPLEEQLGFIPFTVEKIKLRNTLHHIKKKASVRYHKIDKCNLCRSARDEFEENEFHKWIQRTCFNKKIEKDLMHMLPCVDTLTMIGEFVQSIPKFSDGNNAVWNKISDRVKELQGTLQ